MGMARGRSPLALRISSSWRSRFTCATSSAHSSLVRNPQPYSSKIISRSRRAVPGRGGRSHQPLGLFQVEGLRFRTPQGMLQAEAIEHVAFGAATAPGVLEQSADVAEILGQAAFGAATLALGFKPMQIILQRKMP